MNSDEETDDEVERRLRSYKDLRARLNLPPLADDEPSRRLLASYEDKRIADEARRQEREQESQRRRDAWEHRVLATHEDVTIVGRKDEVFSQVIDGEQTLLPPPHFPFALNELNQDLDLNTVSTPNVVDEKGYAWTRTAVIAFFRDDGSRLTVHWVACAHEPKCGWEYSHAIVQRVTWGRMAIDGRLSWNWMETIERPELFWGSSTEPWTSY